MATDDAESPWRRCLERFTLALHTGDRNPTRELTCCAANRVAQFCSNEGVSIRSRSAGMLKIEVYPSWRAIHESRTQ